MDDASLTDRDRADALLRIGRFPEAIELLRNLVKAFPDEESHLLALAWALHDSGDRREAASCFELLFQRELARNLGGGFAYDELVRIHREGNNPEGLLSVCERAAAAQPEDPGLLKTLGDAYLTAGRPTDALRVFERLTAREPDAPEHWCSLGNARLAAGVPGEAEAAYARAAELTPADAAAFFSRLADAFLRAGHLERSQAAGERCAALAPDEPLYLMNLGSTLLGRGDADAAAGAYARAASLNPASAGVIWYRLGTLLATEGFHDRAAEAFTNAAATEPGNSRYLLALAASYAARGLTDLAAETLRRVDSPDGDMPVDHLPQRPTTG